MAERPKAVVLKTTERKLRGFESLSLRQFDMGGPGGLSNFSKPFHTGRVGGHTSFSKPFHTGRVGGHSSFSQPFDMNIPGG